MLDDHEPTRRLLAQLLERRRYRVLTASDGDAGERLLQQERVDLVVTDLTMPGKDGMTLLQETRRAGLDVEFIVMTGYDDEETVVQALRDGALNFLRKPFDVDQVLLAIEKALDYQAVRRSLAYRTREAELMQELVVRLTHRLEVIVQTPGELASEMTGFLRKLVDSLPLGVAVVGADRGVLFANRHVMERSRATTAARLSPEWLEMVGLANVSESDLDETFARAIGSPPGTIETLALSTWAFLVMTPLRLVGPDTGARFVALVMRGERQMSQR